MTSQTGVAGEVSEVHTGQQLPRPPGAGRSVARRLLPTDRIACTAAAIGLAAWLWHAIVVLRAYFFQDDFLFLYNATHTALTPSYLLHSYHGNVMPGPFLLIWLVARIDPLNHALAVLPLLALAAAALALMWSCLVGLCGRRWVLLVPFSVFALSPAVFFSTTWWAYSLEFTPLLVAMLAAVRAQIRFVHTGAVRHAIAALCWTAVGMLCWDKAILVPIVVIGVTVLLAPAPRRLAWTPRWYWLLAHVVLACGYAALYLFLTRHDPGFGPVPVRDVPALAATMVGRTFLPALLGGPWTVASGSVTGWTVDPPLALAITLAVVAVVIVAGIRIGGSRGVWAFAVLAIYLAADVALVAVGRLAAFGPLIGGDPRYTADAVPVAVLCLSAAFIAVPATVPKPRPVLARVGVLALGTALAASAVVTVVGPAGRVHSTAARGYVTTALAALRDNPDLVLYDGGVPADVMLAWFGSSARVSVVLGERVQPMTFDQPTDDLRILDATGIPRHIAFSSVVTGQQGPVARCGYAVSATGVNVPLTGPAQGDRLVVRIGYYAGPGGAGQVRIGDQATNVWFEPGLHDVFVVAATAPADTVQIATAGSTVCVTDVSVGVPVPASD